MAKVTVARADIAFSASLSEEMTRVSQHFGTLTIRFSRCACERRSADGVRIGLGMVSFWIVLCDCFCWLLLLILRREKRESAADRLLLISSMDLGESAGEPSFLTFLVALDSLRLALSIDASLEDRSDELRNPEGPARSRIAGFVE
ncbi:hypothetical protein F511_36101 [Dorcoceras hygrometricum]|uniref:Uncharacterized protein n=1 Tax=Dorcoceras hygrometricum TaxID=472368 RepID=A0A2Z7DAI7_9LAMI|nr:hypothetical protein F511_36101 [Dorcoceras hygrometricum]